MADNCQIMASVMLIAFGLLMMQEGRSIDFCNDEWIDEGLRLRS
jgi:sulfite exporter TauE/SafE